MDDGHQLGWMTVETDSSPWAAVRRRGFGFLQNYPNPFIYNQLVALEARFYDKSNRSSPHLSPFRNQPQPRQMAVLWYR